MNKMYRYDDPLNSAPYFWLRTCWDV